MVRQRAGSWWRDAATTERKVWSRLGLAASIAVFAVFASACVHGSRDPYSRYVDRGDAGKPRHFVVLPVNLTIEAPPEFGPVLDDMFGAIAGYIRDRGDTLETFSRKEATAQWAESIVKVEESKALDNNFEAAMRAYVAHLAGTRSFDAVITPSLVYRTTKTRDRTVKWDGVFRKMKIVNLSEEAKAKGFARALVMNISGVSLHVMVFSPDGDLIFQRYGGLDLAHNVDMTSAEFTMNPGLLLKEDLLKESDHISEGIGVAFNRYLPMRKTQRELRPSVAGSRTNPKSDKDQETISFRSSANASFCLGSNSRCWKDRTGLDLQTGRHRAAELDRWGAEPDERVRQFGGFAPGVGFESQTRRAARAHDLALFGTTISKSMRT